MSKTISYEQNIDKKLSMSYNADKENSIIGGYIYEKKNIINHDLSTNHSYGFSWVW